MNVSLEYMKGEREIKTHKKDKTRINKDDRFLTIEKLLQRVNKNGKN